MTLETTHRTTSLQAKEGHHCQDYPRGKLLAEKETDKILLQRIRMF